MKNTIKEIMKMKQIRKYGNNVNEEHKEITENK